MKNYLFDRIQRHNNFVYLLTVKRKKWASFALKYKKVKGCAERTQKFNWCRRYTIRSDTIHHIKPFTKTSTQTHPTIARGWKSIFIKGLCQSIVFKYSEAVVKQNNSYVTKSKEQTRQQMNQR